MSVFCPKDGQPCIDDICNAGMCVQTGDEPYEKCEDCGALVELDMPCEECELDQDEDYWDEEE